MFSYILIYTTWKSSVISPWVKDIYYLVYSSATFCSATAAKSLQLCPTLYDPRQQPTRLHCRWDSPGKNTGGGCHCFLQCMKVKSESEGAQLCPTPSDPMDCSLPGCSIHRILQARVLEWVTIAFSTFCSRHTLTHIVLVFKNSKVTPYVFPNFVHESIWVTFLINTYSFDFIFWGL